MPNILPIIADKLANTPLLLSPDKAHTVLQVLGGRIGIDGIEAPAPEASAFKATRKKDADGHLTTLFRKTGSVGVVQVHGSLVNRGAWLDAHSGLTSYEGVAAQIDAALSDDGVEAIILDIDSHGGEATGMLALAEKVRAANAIKPVVAVVNDIAASAAYGIASGAGEIVISESSFVGSIGVVYVHMDHSAELEKKGVKATIIHAGANKADGHPFAPLSADVRGDLQKRVDTIYNRFLEAVSAGRGSRLSSEAARKTEAQVFVGQEAIDRGLADRVASFDMVLAEYQQKARTGEAKKGTVTMGDGNTNPESAGANMVPKADHDAALASARAEGAASERKRIGAIMGSDEAKGRETTALSMALNNDMAAMSSASVCAVLATTPKTTEPKAGSDTPSIASRSEGEPEIGASDPADTPAKAAGGWEEVISAMQTA